MKNLIEVSGLKDIPTEILHTPVGLFIQYHNLHKPFNKYEKAQLLIGMCMDNRMSLLIPENFAYIIRTGGTNIKNLEFQISYAIAVGSVKHIVLMAHNKCAMVNLISKKEQFIKGLVENGGWYREAAEEHFMHFAPLFEIYNETDFVLSEVKRLQLRYPGVVITPAYYNVDNGKIYLFAE
jgi:carbonic anhydrase